MSQKMSAKYHDQKIEKQEHKSDDQIVEKQQNEHIPVSETMSERGIPVSETMIERGCRNYIHELTMQTMVNRDVIRKIKERQQIIGVSGREMTFHQFQEISRELWDITQTREFSMDMNSCYPYELQKIFNEFVDQTRHYLEKHPPISSSFYDDNIHEKSEAEFVVNKHEKREEDTKEIHMAPVFMEKQHPLWNYNHFNRRKAIHAYPPDSEYHISGSSSSSNHSNLERGGIWKREYHGGYQDTLFGELEEEP
jgi:hypothetical protein